MIPLEQAMAEEMYAAYCIAVGGKAFNGDSLPDWDTFYADPSKRNRATHGLRRRKQESRSFPISMVSNGFPSGPYKHDEHGMALPSYPKQVEILEGIIKKLSGEIVRQRSEIFRLRNEAKRKR